MIIVDRELKRRAAAGEPVRVGIIGAGYSGQRIVYQILTAVAGMDVCAVANRTVERAQEALRNAGANDVELAESPEEIDRAYESGRRSVTRSFEAVTAAKCIDVIVECTGTVEYGAAAALSAIDNAKHLVLMNVELDATIGPLLKARADERGVVYSNSDGDEPGVAMNMIRFVRSIGLEPVVAGNLKGLYDPYRNPQTQEAFARARGQKPATMAHFADGTKLSMELTVLANAAGFGVGRRGMYGPKLAHVNDSPAYYADKIVNGGMVDYLCGAAPSNGAFVIGYSVDPMRKDYLEYLKMGEGPYYVFYTPFHLPQLEIPLTVARAALFDDATVAPIGKPYCDSIAVAKRDLEPGDVLDGFGGFNAYALIEGYETSVQSGLLPIGVSEGCVLKRAKKKDDPITYDDVELPDGRLIDRLRTEQNQRFELV